MVLDRMVSVNSEVLPDRNRGVREVLDRILLVEIEKLRNEGKEGTLKLQACKRRRRRRRQLKHEGK